MSQADLATGHLLALHSDTSLDSDFVSMYVQVNNLSGCWPCDLNPRPLDNEAMMLTQCHPDMLCAIRFKDYQYILNILFRTLCTSQALNGVAGGDQWH